MRVRDVDFRKVANLRHVDWHQVIKNPASRKIVVRNRTVPVPGRVINFGFASGAGAIAAGALLLASDIVVSNVHAIPTFWHTFPQVVQHDAPRVAESFAFRSGMQAVLQKREKRAWKDRMRPALDELDDDVVGNTEEAETPTLKRRVRCYVKVAKRVWATRMFPRLDELLDELDNSRKRRALEAEPLTFKKRVRCYADVVPWVFFTTTAYIGGVLLLTQVPFISPLHGVWKSLPAAVKTHWVPTMSGWGIRHGYAIATKPIRVDRYRKELLADHANGQKGSQPPGAQPPDAQPPQGPGTGLVVAA